MIDQGVPHDKVNTSDTFIRFVNINGKFQTKFMNRAQWRASYLDSVNWAGRSM